ncbi:beta-lactamase family protein [Pseudomonadales bacterium]|jgi:CubicO group peptidase (beta-lactamase class C family)|nr:beta-lactamase family protein [Pseudomonadales bacterium]MDA9366505.1 beta-lactamase family protein [Pseudomonadales bacterium]MDB9867732.1 beta-lactamase family protein [Pseudomonadales bacterium]MDB9917417.1 beta-lactamase family protein [Pseudomonadales bacterium]
MNRVGAMAKYPQRSLSVSDLVVHGHCDSKFEAVRRGFVENFTQRDELGASVAVVYEGELVVDLWAGYGDADRTRPWLEDTLVNVWSVGKAMTALTLLHLLENRNIDVNSRVADHWPEFAQAGKGQITLAQAMSHQAGLCGIDSPLPTDAYFHWDLMTAAIARQKPWWVPGQAHGYHTNTFGFLLGEPLQRIAGQSFSDYFQQQIAGPLGMDFQFGVAADQQHRCADLTFLDRAGVGLAAPVMALDASDTLGAMRERVANNPPLLSLGVNSTAWRRAVFPSTNPQSNARSVARCFGELALIAAGKRVGVISQAQLNRATQIVSDGLDLNVQRPTRFGLGFQLTQPDRPLGPNPGTFGHYGNGGHLGFADPSRSLGFAYHMNHQGFAWRDPRNITLTDAVYRSL